MGTDSSEYRLRQSTGQTALLMGKATKIIGVTLLVLFAAPAHAQAAAPPVPPGMTLPSLPTNPPPVAALPAVPVPPPVLTEPGVAPPASPTAPPPTSGSTAGATPPTSGSTTGATPPSSSALPPVLVCHSSVFDPYASSNYYTSPAESSALAACNDAVTWYNRQWPVFAVNLISCDAASQTMVVGSWFAPPATYYVGCKAKNTCPVHASGTPCFCDAGYVPDSAGACVPETLTLVLQGGATSTEPWNKIHDPDHAQANVLFSAIVVNNLGAPKPNIPVTINADVTDNSGGHHHTANRPKGKLLETTDGIADASSQLTVNTDASGLATFYFGAEEASGEHTLTATCDKCTNAPRTAKVNVEITGLGKLNIVNPCDPRPMLKILCLRGETPPHPDNHYYTAEAMNQIMILSIQYDTKFQKNILPQLREPLRINDSSLQKGGLLDIAKNWKPDHKGHRRGIVVDINNYHTRNLSFEKFVENSQPNGIHVIAVWEGPPKQPNTPPHYHLQLLGRDE